MKRRKDLLVRACVVFLPITSSFITGNLLGFIVLCDEKIQGKGQHKIKDLRMISKKSHKKCIMKSQTPGEMEGEQTCFYCFKFP